MTSVRQSFVFGAESEYGKGKASGYKWIAPPPGSYISTEHSRAAQRVQSTGTKFWDTVAYGKLTGSFTWTFTLDYNYLEPFFFAFEEYTTPATESKDYSTGNDKDNTGRYHTSGYYTFAKKDYSRVKSFTIRRKIINNITGNTGKDELSELRGCVIRNVRMAKASNTSQVNVTFTGFYSNEKLVEGTLNTTDFKPYDGKLAEYMCMYTTDSSSPNTASDYVYVANTDSLELSIGNNLDAIFTTCSPFAKNYYEGVSDFAFSTSCYSDDPERYKLRVYGGGSKVNPTSTGGNTYVPATKGLTPLKGIRLYTYDGTATDSTSDEPSSTTDTVISNSENIMMIDIRECVIKSLTWPKGDSKLQDVISSAECKNIWLQFKVKNTPVFDPTNSEVKNKISDSPDPTTPSTSTSGTDTSGTDTTGTDTTGTDTTNP